MTAREGPGSGIVGARGRGPWEEARKLSFFGGENESYQEGSSWAKPCSDGAR